MKPVALLAEGVDRNAQDDVDLVGLRRSPSSRRAWIEIGDGRNDRFGGGVALLAEGVDRNLCYPLNDQIAVCVALLAEGVDRNLIGLDVVLDPANVALLAEGVDRNCMVASMP